MTRVKNKSSVDCAIVSAEGCHRVARTEGGAARRLHLKTIRELTMPGRCVTLGLVLRETALRISYRDRYGTSKFVSKRWAVHTEPCPSCPDYPKAHYEEEGPSRRSRPPVAIEQE